MTIEIEFDAVQPDATRRWHRHQFGLRGVAWEVRGSFERVYFFDQDYVLGELSHLLQSTLVGLAAVIRSEIEAAVEQPMKPEHAATVNQFRTSASNWIGEHLLCEAYIQGLRDASDAMEGKQCQP